jgi:hypothetical protein
MTGPLDVFYTDTAVSYYFLWEAQNLDLPLAEFLHRFPSFVFAAHRAAFAFGAHLAFEAHLDFGLHAMFPPLTLKS